MSGSTISQEDARVLVAILSRAPKCWVCHQKPATDFEARGATITSLTCEDCGGDTNQRATATLNGSRGSALADMRRARTLVDRFPVCQSCNQRESTCTTHWRGKSMAVCVTCRDILSL